VVAEVVTLRGITWDHPRGLAPLRALDRFGVHLQVSWSARSLQEFADVPIERLVDDYDLLVIDHPHLPIVARDGLLVQLDGAGHDEELSEIEKQSVGASHSSYWYGGHQYALAIDAAAQVSVYRPDLISAPPQSWEGVLELAGEGRVLWPGKPVDAMSSFLTLCAARGAAVCSTEESFVPREDGLAALDLLHQLVDDVGGSWANDDPIAVAERLSGGDRWCYAPLVFGYVNYSRPGFRPHRLTYTDLPAGSRGPVGSCLGGAGIAVSSRTAWPAAAVSYAFFLASAETQRGTYYWSGGQPGNSVAWEDQQINGDCMDFFTSTRATLEGAVVRPRHPGWIELQELLGAAVHAALDRSISDDQCLLMIEEGRERVLQEVQP